MAASVAVVLALGLWQVAGGVLLSIFQASRDPASGRKTLAAGGAHSAAIRAALVLERCGH